MKIGFIGLGIMGLPMARNLLKAGHSLMVCGHHPEKERELEDLGAVRGTQQEIGSSCQLVLTMLPNSPQVYDAMLGPGGAGYFMAPGSVYVDMSSIDPVQSRRIGAELGKRGITMLDAPVSGGEPKAVDGTLSFMVGGDRETFEKVRPLLLTMGASAVLCGELGAGNTAKLANQIIVACNIQALAEALTLAKKAGVDPECVFAAIRGGLAGSTVMDAKAPMMLSGNDRPGFRVDLHIKDLSNALDCAHAVGAAVPMTAQAQEVLQYLHAHGFGGCDHSAMARYYEALSGISLDGSEKEGM